MTEFWKLRPEAGYHFYKEMYVYPLDEAHKTDRIEFLR
jgi:hypothetical protein